MDELRKLRDPLAKCGVTWKVMQRMKALFPILTLLSFLLLISCGEDSQEDKDILVEHGKVFGIVTDKETGRPISGATITIGGKTALTDAQGKYAIEGVPFSDNVDVTITAQGYKEYKAVISVKSEFLSLNVELVSLSNPFAPIMSVLDGLCEDIAALDPNRIPAIQARFTKDYKTAEDEATAFGIFAGVIPPNYDSIPDTIRNIIKKYSFIEFKFANPDIQLNDSSASVQMRFMINAKTNPPEPKRWEVIVNGKLGLQKQDGEWKINFWGLIPPFIKFEENPI